MPRKRTYYDFTDTEVFIIKTLYKACKSNNGNININTKSYMDDVNENLGKSYMGNVNESIKFYESQKNQDFIITNYNKMSDVQIIQFITFISKYIYKIKIDGIEISTIRNIIRYR